MWLRFLICFSFFFVASEIPFILFYQEVSCATRLEIGIAAKFLCFELEIKSVAENALHVTYVFIHHHTQVKTHTSYGISSHSSYMLTQKQNETSAILNKHRNIEEIKCSAVCQAAV